MIGASGPAEDDDSRETNIAVALLTTDAMVDGETRVRMMLGIAFGASLPSRRTQKSSSASQQELS